VFVECGVKVLDKGLRKGFVLEEKERLVVSKKV
jgi:hypothetical protein